MSELINISPRFVSSADAPLSRRKGGVCRSHTSGPRGPLLGTPCGGGPHRGILSTALGCWVPSRMVLSGPAAPQEPQDHVSVTHWSELPAFHQGDLVRVLPPTGLGGQRDNKDLPRAVGPRCRRGSWNSSTGKVCGFLSGQRAFGVDPDSHLRSRSERSLVFRYHGGQKGSTEWAGPSRRRHCESARRQVQNSAGCASARFPGLCPLPTPTPGSAGLTPDLLLEARLLTDASLPGREFKVSGLGASPAT